LKTKNYTTLKNAVGYYNAGVVAVNQKIVGLGPGIRQKTFHCFSAGLPDISLSRHTKKGNMYQMT
jgi:hypothetical protein